MIKHTPFTNRFLLPLAVLLMALQVQAASRTVSFSDIMLNPGGTAEMVVSYETDYADLNAFQLEFVLPDGITLVDAHVGNSLSQTCPNLYFSFNPKRDDGNTVIMCYNLYGTLPTGKQEAFVLKFQADNDAAKRTYGIETTRLEFTHKGSSASDLLDNKTFFITVKKPYISTMRGDVNNDHENSLADILMIVDYILGTPDSDFLVSNADFNGDGDISLADILMLVDVILGNTDGMSFRWFLMAQSSDGKSYPIPLERVGGLAAAGDAYDFTILDNAGNILLENVMRAEFKYEFEIDTDAVEELTAKPASGNPAANTAQGNNTFVVADKSGNSLFVQGVTFQHGEDGASWMAGSLSGDIGDLQFIARTDTKMATGSGDDVIQMLEELSGTDEADAEAVSTALTNNPDVVDSYTADGGNVVVKLSGQDAHIVYPLYDMSPLFSEEDLPAGLATQKRSPRADLRRAGSTLKVAIFNYYDGFDYYKTQNAIVDAIYDMFYNHGYDVEYFGDGSNGNLFTEGALKNVVNRSEEYKAIIIMGHGGCRWTDVNDYDQQFPEIAKMTRHTIATRYEKRYGDATTYLFKEPADGRYYYMMDCELGVKGNCILYDGTCWSAPTSGYSDNEAEYPNVNKSVLLGWNGRNRVSQAHAALFFYRMLCEQKDLSTAYNMTFQQDLTEGAYYLVKNYNDPTTHGRDHTRIFKSKYASNQSLKGNSSLQKQYYGPAFLYLSNPGDKMIKDAKEDGGYMMRVSGVIDGRLGKDPKIQVKLEPIYGNGEYTTEVYPIKLSEEDKYDISTWIHIKTEGIYDVTISLKNSSTDGYSTDGYRMLHTNAPLAVIYSGTFMENCVLPAVSDEDTRVPLVINSSDEAVDSVTLNANSTVTYSIDGYAGHEFKAFSFDTDIVNASVNGTTLTVTGVSEGSALIGVYDVQNYQMKVLNVTVTPGGTPQAYLTCPDDHHPHLIDLGLPSGTKWACCNVDTDHPENQAPANCGGYYAWGETETKTTYDWSTYIHCDGSESTCHDLDSDIAGTQYDVAHVKWGGSWVLPSINQLTELTNNCNSELTTINGIKGFIFTGSNGGSIFLPEAGAVNEYGFSPNRNVGVYWSSKGSRVWSTDEDNLLYCAYSLIFDYSDFGSFNCSRYWGLSVRPVAR